MAKGASDCLDHCLEEPLDPGPGRLKELVMWAEAHEGRGSAEGLLLGPAQNLKLLPRKTLGLSPRWGPKSRNMGWKMPYAASPEASFLYPTQQWS